MKPILKLIEEVRKKKDAKDKKSKKSDVIINPTRDELNVV